MTKTRDERIADERQQQERRAEMARRAQEAIEWPDQQPEYVAAADAEIDRRGHEEG